MRRNHLRVILPLFCVAVLAPALGQGPELQVGPLQSMVPKPELTAADVDAQITAGASIPLWKVVATSNGVNYTLSLVGKSIFLAGASMSVSIPAPVVALDLRFYNANGTSPLTFRPETTNSCLPTASAVNLVLHSPVYQSHAYTFGGKSIGTTQYVDAFQRANFYHYTNPGGTTPGYHVLLNPTAHYYFYSTAFTVPLSEGHYVPSKCGNLGLVFQSYIQNLIRVKIIPGLASAGIGPTSFPVVLVYNVVMCSSSGRCGIAGFHDGYKNSAGSLQTYLAADYDTTGIGLLDIEAVSHEVGEWMNNPALTNMAPSWGNIGQVPGCSGFYEVGDPLTGHTASVLMPNGKTYHPQQMAFISWFYRLFPSLGPSGFYSNLGTFKGYSKVCPPGGTN